MNLQSQKSGIFWLVNKLNPLAVLAKGLFMFDL